jgi:hypothetical protein
MAELKVNGEPLEGDEDLTDWERLQIAAIAQILKTGEVTVSSHGLEVLIDYTDRLNEHAQPQ